MLGGHLIGGIKSAGLGVSVCTYEGASTALEMPRIGKGTNMNSRTPWLHAIIGSVSLVVAGCQTQRPPVMAIPDVKLTHYVGTPLARAQAAAPDVSAADSLGLQIRSYLIAGVPGRIMQPFASAAGMVTASEGDTPLLAVPSSLADARIGIGNQAIQSGASAAAGSLGPAIELTTQTGVLAPGISAQMRVSPMHTSVQAGDFQEVELAFARVDHAAKAIRVALSREALYAPPPNGEQATAQLPAPQRETAITSLGYTEGQVLNVAVLVPVSITPGIRQSVLLLARITPAGQDPAHVAAAEAASAQLAANLGKAEAASYEEIVLRSALRSAQNSATRRAALVYLATEAQAPIFLDAALVADDVMLRGLAADLKTASEGADKAAQQPLGWRLDRVAFDAMGKLMIQQKLQPELRAVLGKHAGEAGRNSASLEQLLGRTVSRKDLENRLLAENYIFLEDISPSARVRAYDWLNAIGKAPAGYDPLGPVEQRRRALEAAIEQMTRSSSSGD